MIVPCDCGAKLKIDDAKVAGREARIRCPRCGTLITIAPPPEPMSTAYAQMRAQTQAPARTETPAALSTPPPAPRYGGTEPLVIVAHESDTMRDMIGGILQDAGFRVEHAEDGMVALVKAEELGPQVMLIDVGLPGIYGFELCERMRADASLSRIKIILLASVYGVTRYKRKPANLYGADDYIEKHHIADSLVEKINSLLQGGGDGAGAAAPLPGRSAAAPLSERRKSALETELFNPESLAGRDTEHPASATAAASETVKQAEGFETQSWAADSTVAPDSFSIDSSVFDKDECDIPVVEPHDPEAVEKAKRFARIIISDIALYNQEAVNEGVRNGTFYDLLKNDVEEGRLLYESRVPASVRAKRDYYQETIENFIKAQKKIVR